MDPICGDTSLRRSELFLGWVWSLDGTSWGTGHAKSSQGVAGRTLELNSRRFHYIYIIVVRTIEKHHCTCAASQHPV